MKKPIISVIAMAFIFTVSNANKTSETKTAQLSVNPQQLYACPMHPEVTGKKGEKCSKCGMALTVEVKETPKTNTESTSVQSSFSINEIVSNYLILKNALTKDDATTAANAGKAIVTAMAKLDIKNLSVEQKKAFNEVADDLKENAEHIGSNAGKIAHQREHFAMLSKDVADLVKTFGNGGQKLYQDFCPMYDNGKGAIWVSEIKEIKNPYFGKKMSTCGSIKKEL